MRVAITGIGIVSPFGRGKRAAAEALRAGRSGVRRIESIDTAGLNCKIGGEVPREAHEGLVKGNDRFTRFALIAAEEACEEANFAGAGFDGERVGSIIGTGMGGCGGVGARQKRISRENAPRGAAQASAP